MKLGHYRVADIRFCTRVSNLAVLYFTSITPDIGCFRALESVRDTKGELMPRVEVHSGQDVAGSLGDTKVDG